MINQILYIDPASTAIIWQIIAGIFIALGAILGIWWKKITTFIKSSWVKMFGSKKKKEDELKDKEIDDELSDEEIKKEINVNNQ